MKKFMFFAAILFAGTFALQSCTTGHGGGGCDAFGGSHAMGAHKEVGKSL